MRNLLRKFLIEDESGAAMIEYSLIVALVSIVAAATLTAVGAAIPPIFTAATTSLTGAL